MITLLIIAGSIIMVGNIIAYVRFISSSTDIMLSGKHGESTWEKIGLLLLIFFLGGYLGYWINGHIIGSEIPFLSLNDEGVNNDYEFDSRRDNRFEAGLAYGLGLAIPLSNRLEMDIDLITHYGLTDMQKKYMRQQNPRYNTTTMLQLGLAYNF